MSDLRYYLNHVGYKGANEVVKPLTNSKKYYLNHVGYKDYTFRSALM